MDGFFLLKNPVGNCSRWAQSLWICFSSQGAVSLEKALCDNLRYTVCMSVPAIVLAAGASRRLGQPKQLVRTDGETLLGRTIRVTQEAGAGPVCVVLGAHAEYILPMVEAANRDVVLNPQWEQGIATSIHCGLRWLTVNVPDANGVLLLVCDQPGLTTQHVCALLDKAASHDSCVVASTYGGIRGVPAMFPKSEFSKLMALQGDEGARGILKSPACCVIDVPFESGAIDIDTPADLAEHVPGFIQR
jgi:molybdenum cofactor cytidylyltransferase